MYQVFWRYPDLVPEEFDAWLDAYLLSASTTTWLDNEEEWRLARLARIGDRQAESALVESSRRIVVLVASRHVRRTEDVSEATPLTSARHRRLLAELVRLGDQGLQTAAQRFEPAKGFKFSTYATWWIRQSITGGSGGTDAPV
jgi:DNA-directed RNA polymerase sigma subunit (sigma70/sigma32)